MPSPITHRRIRATLVRTDGGGNQRVVWTRHYSWLDTAMPRALQVAMHDSAPGDVVEFVSTEYGLRLGTLHCRKGRQFEMEMTALAQNSPNLMKLL